MEHIKDFVLNNSGLLFKHAESNTKLVIFDAKGFFLNESSKIQYDEIMNKPHLYVAWTESEKGYYYIGKSFQSGGRWKRQHAYHLGTLAHHLLNTIRYDDQNHQHWIGNWMDITTISNIGLNSYTIRLKYEVKIAFIPFELYSDKQYCSLEKGTIRSINSSVERALIQSYKNDNIILLNVQHN